jgi:DNA-binding HxlR family transcriptional regulator
MAEYRQYCPVARAAEVLADRWTPLIIRELVAGVRHFNEIERGLPGISRSVLAGRLRHLEDHGVVERLSGPGPHNTEYRLTDAGGELRRVLDSLGAWGARWAFGDPRPEELDPALLLWRMRRRLRASALPRQRVVIEFDFSGRGGRRIWLVIDQREASVCLRPPGFDPDLVVRADLALFYRIWVGRADYDAAVRSGQLSLDGMPALKRSFSRWWLWSPMAPHVRAARQPAPRA